MPGGLLNIAHLHIRRLRGAHQVPESRQQPHTGPHPLRCRSGTDTQRQAGQREKGFLT
jgi:hypothetical protein